MKFEINFKDLYNEEWREIKGFKDYYVSDYGRVANFNYRNTGDSILLKPFNTKDGYEQISLVNNGKKIKKLVHRLVAEALLIILYILLILQIIFFLLSFFTPFF